MVKVAADALIALVADIFTSAGCSRAEGQRISSSLVGANLTGHDSHGVVRVPRYLSWMDEGVVFPDRDVTRVVDTPVISVLDGNYGFGQTIAPIAVREGIAKCEVQGLACVALRNVGHVGRVGEWAEMAAEAGLVSIHHVNAPASLLVAPFGGIDRRFSTAPYSVGVPRSDGRHLILDFATSVVAEGKVLVASQGGKPLPDNALVSGEGEIGADPRYLYGDYAEGSLRDHQSGKGAIRAMGDHKGSGLAFMTELLGGSLTGVGAPLEGRHWTNGMLTIFIDPAVLDPDGFFPDDITRYLKDFKATRAIEPGGEVLYPGEPERRRRAERLKDGVPLPEETWNSIKSAALDQGLEAATLDRIAEPA